MLLVEGKKNTKKSFDFSSSFPVVMADEDAPKASAAEMKQFECLVPLLEREGPFQPREFFPGAAEKIAHLASVRIFRPCLPASLLLSLMHVFRYFFRSHPDLPHHLRGRRNGY
jgi:hypothetical protein